MAALLVSINNVRYDIANAWLQSGIFLGAERCVCEMVSLWNIALTWILDNIFYPCCCFCVSFDDMSLCNEWRCKRGERRAELQITIETYSTRVTWWYFLRHGGVNEACMLVRTSNARRCEWCAWRLRTMRVPCATHGTRQNCWMPTST